MPSLGKEMCESYSMPMIAQAYPEGPVRYHGDGVVATYPMDEDIYEECIPEPLEATDQPTCQFLSVDYTRTSGLGTYQELMVSLPALYEGDAIAYSPIFLLNGSVATAAGREVLGIQKVNCDISFAEYGKEVQRVYTKDDVDVLSLTMAPEREVTDWDELPLEDGMQIASWKRIPSMVPGEPPAVDRIVTSLISDLSIEWAREGPVSLEISESVDAPLHLFEPTGDISGYQVKFSWLGGEHEDAILHTFDEYNPQEVDERNRPCRTRRFVGLSRHRRPFPH